MVQIIPADEGRQGNSGAPPSPRHVDLELPSNFVFYSFDRLYCRGLSLNELNMLHVAKETGSLRHLVHAVGRCIHAVDETGQKVDARSLTLGDFYFILYWLRINSYGVVPYTVDWSCDNPEHKELADTDLVLCETQEEKEKVLRARETLKNVTKIEQSMLQTQNPQFDTMVEHMKAMREKFGILPAMQLMDDAIAEAEIVENTVKEYRKKIKALEDTKGKKKVNKEDVDRLIEESREQLASASVEKTFIQELAAHVHRQHGQTLADRINFLTSRDDLGPDFMDDMEEFKELAGHGVIEEMHFTCRGCQHRFKHTLEIDVLDFFPDHPARRNRK